MLFLQRIDYLTYPTQAKCSGSTVLPNNIHLFIQQHPLVSSLTSTIIIVDVGLDSNIIISISNIP